mmetsp:Transcript_19875/g.43457  ORF Transcript_19875/g.43457 Transcript_19875/m.43457 type:complete len:203 (-) Transcript_19875:241-849(-)
MCLQALLKEQEFLLLYCPLDLQGLGLLFVQLHSLHLDDAQSLRGELLLQPLLCLPVELGGLPALLGLQSVLSRVQVAEEFPEKVPAPSIRLLGRRSVLVLLSSPPLLLLALIIGVSVSSTLFFILVFVLVLFLCLVFILLFLLIRLLLLGSLVLFLILLTILVLLVLIIGLPGSPPLLLSALVAGIAVLVTIARSRMPAFPR